MLGAKTSQHCEPDQTLFARGAYTESDNAPARKIGSGYARLSIMRANEEPDQGKFYPQGRGILFSSKNVAFIA